MDLKPLKPTVLDVAKSWEQSVYQWPLLVRCMTSIHDIYSLEGLEVCYFENKFLPWLRSLTWHVSVKTFENYHLMNLM